MRRRAANGSGNSAPGGSTPAEYEEQMRRRAAEGGGNSAPGGGSRAEYEEQMRRRSGNGGGNNPAAAGAAPGAMPAGPTPPGQPMPGQLPGGAPPGFNAGGAGEQSAFGNVEPGSPEFAIQQFIDLLNSGDLSGAADLFSRKAIGKAKVIRDGKASDDMISELKADIANVKAQPAMHLQGKHVIVLEENSAANASGLGVGPGSPGAEAYGGRQRRSRSSDRSKTATRKVQFTLVQEEGGMRIQDIKVSKTAASMRNR